MIKISEMKSKTTPRKKNIQLKNISLHDLNLIDTDTGENITQEVLVALPEGTETVILRLRLSFQKKNKLGGE